MPNDVRGSMLDVMMRDVGAFVTSSAPRGGRPGPSDIRDAVRLFDLQAGRMARRRSRDTVVS